MILLDVSASGNFGSVAESKRELGAGVAALLAFSAIHNNDKVGLILFTDQIELFHPPKEGTAAHPAVDSRNAFFCAGQSRHQDCLFFGVSQQTHHASGGGLYHLRFSGWGFFPTVDRGCQNGTISWPFRSSIRWRRFFPRSGSSPWRILKTGGQIEVDTSHGEVLKGYQALARRREKELARLFGARRIDVVPLRTDKDYLPVLRSFFARRERRMAA